MKNCFLFVASLPTFSALDVLKVFLSYLLNFESQHQVHVISLMKIPTADCSRHQACFMTSVIRAWLVICFERKCCAAGSAIFKSLGHRSWKLELLLEGSWQMT